jgi:hypothetical protein
VSEYKQKKSEEIFVDIQTEEEKQVKGYCESAIKWSYTWIISPLMFCLFVVSQEFNDTSHLTLMHM